MLAHQFVGAQISTPTLRFTDVYGRHRRQEKCQPHCKHGHQSTSVRRHAPAACYSSALAAFESTAANVHEVDPVVPLEKYGEEHFMRLALEEARLAGEAGEVPVGAVLVHNGEQVVAKAGNDMESSGDPTGHAEMHAIRQALQRLSRFELPNCRLYVTLEPCPMCAGALLQARLGSVVYAASNPLLGADGSWIQLLRAGRQGARGCASCPDRPHAFHPDIQVKGGVLAEESAALMRAFFQSRRLEGSRT